MKDLDRSIRDAARRHEPPADWLERIRTRADRRRRNRRVVAATVGMGLSLAVFVPLALELSSLGPHPGDRPGSPLPAAPCGLEGPVTALWRWEGSTSDEVHGSDAELAGEAGFSAGLAGEALTLDGAGDFAVVADDPALNVRTDDFTIAMWARFRTTEGEQVLAEDWVETFDPSTSTGWTLIKLNSGRIGLGLGSTGVVNTPRLELPSDTWIHVAARRQGDRVGIFIDGQEIASRRLRIPARTLDSDSSLRFGSRGGPQDTPGSLDERGLFLNGQLDEVVFVVGRSLSDEEIARLFASPPACGPTAPNVALGGPTTASASRSGHPPSGAVDGSSRSVWNSGDYAPQWIEIDLGAPQTIGRIALLPTQLPDGETVHRVLGRANDTDPYQLLHEFADFTSNSEWLEEEPSDPWVGIRFIRIESTVSPSWIGWREIQVYPAAT